MAAAEFVDGNRLTLLNSGAEFFPALIAAIDGAQRDIHLETYIFAADRSGLAVADALIAAALARGTRIAALGGGCFFNRILRERVEQRLTSARLTVVQTGAKGCGDAGLALGQAWVAAQTLAPSQQPSVEETLSCA